MLPRGTAKVSRLQQRCPRLHTSCTEALCCQALSQKFLALLLSIYTLVVRCSSNFFCSQDIFSYSFLLQNYPLCCQIVAKEKVILCKFALRFCISCASASWLNMRQLCQVQTNVPLLPQPQGCGTVCSPWSEKETTRKRRDYNSLTCTSTVKPVKHNNKVVYIFTTGQQTFLESSIPSKAIKQRQRGIVQ